MDERRIDGLARRLAPHVGRRRLAAGAVAALLGRLGGPSETLAGCAKPGRTCEKTKDCCGGHVKCRGGKCNCKNGSTECDGKCRDLDKDEKHCGRCRNACPPGGSCDQGTCFSELGCRAGFNFCRAGEPFPLCPGTSIATCHCVTDVEGTPRCIDFIAGDCSNCRTNANCPIGFVCIDARGECGCTGPEFNGRACVPSNCDGRT